MCAVDKKFRQGFTLVELLVVMAIVGILAGFLLPALSKAQERSAAIVCLNNTKQLLLGWQMYAGDHDDLLPYNIGMAGSSFRTNLNWVNNVMTWDLSPDNTNPATITEASLAPYVSGAVKIYHCPSDHALSAIQNAAGWTARVRSYSMNAMVGNAGNFIVNGANQNNPGYKQFFKLSQIPSAADIFVFLDENPDSINDGYFLNKYPRYTSAAGTYLSNGGGNSDNASWLHLPATTHAHATSLSFADGHAELHRWLKPTTFLPATAQDYLPISIPSSPVDARTDFNWLMDRTSIEAH